MADLVLPSSTSKVPVKGDLVLVRRSAGTEPLNAFVATDPEPDTPGRHRLDLWVLDIPPEVRHRIVPATDVETIGWFWRGCDVPDVEPGMPADVEKLLTRLIEAEHTPVQGESTANWLQGEIHEAIKEVRSIGVRLAKAEVAEGELEAIRAAERHG